MLKHWFLPSRANNHHPHILKREIVVGVLCAALVLEVAVLAQGVLLFNTPNNLASVLPAVVASLTNDQRTENNLPVLTVSPLLSEAAQEKANDEAAKGYFSHVSPDGTLPWQWFKNVGYDYEFAGENLAVNFTDSSDVVNAWMASPEHRANILKQDYTQEGIGMATGMYQGKSTIFVVQFFASPASADGSDTDSAPIATAPKPSPVASAIRDVKVALNDVPAKTTPTQPVPAPDELMTTSSTSDDTGSSTPAVLGTETGPAAPTFLQKLLASPFSTSNYLFAGVASFILAVLVIALINRKRLPRLSATIGGLAIIVVLLGFAIANVTFFAGKTIIGTATQISVENPKA